MDGIWPLLAFQLISMISGVVTACLVLLVGGVGGTLALARRLEALEGTSSDTSRRLEREIKRRAGEIGVEARKGRAALEAEAAAIVAETRPTEDPKRPSPLVLR